jgi:ABC-type multidrug transport system ATPase subunit
MPTNLKPNRQRRGRSLSRRSHHVMELLRSLANEDEHAVVAVTHDHRATRFADRLLVLQDGQIMHDQDGHSSVRWREIARETVAAEEVRFALDSPLEGDVFELPVPREIGLRRGRRLALHLGSLTLRRRDPDWNATKRRRDSERRASTAAE